MGLPVAKEAVALGGGTPPPGDLKSGRVELYVKMQGFVWG